MGLRFFVVSVMNPEASEQELNGFLASHKVVSIERKLIDQGVNSFWAICVVYLSHAPDAGAYQWVGQFRGQNISSPNKTRTCDIQTFEWHPCESKKPARGSGMKKMTHASRGSIVPPAQLVMGKNSAKKEWQVPGRAQPLLFTCRAEV